MGWDGWWDDRRNGDSNSDNDSDSDRFSGGVGNAMEVLRGNKREKTGEMPNSSCFAFEIQWLRRIPVNVRYRDMFSSMGGLI